MISPRSDKGKESFLAHGFLKGWDLTDGIPCVILQEKVRSPWGRLQQTRGYVLRRNPSCCNAGARGFEPPTS